MGKAIIIAILIHCCLLLGASYIYVFRLEKRDAIFKNTLHTEKIMPTKRVSIAPPGGQKLKKAPPPTYLPIRAKPIEVIAVKKVINPELTLKLPKTPRVTYSPEIAVVSMSRIAAVGEGESFEDRGTGLKDREIRLESFGVTALKPLGSPENPVTRMIVQIVSASCDHKNEVGIFYPEKRSIATGLTGIQSMNIDMSLGPYTVPPEQIVFYLTSPEIGGQILLSTDPAHCRQTHIEPNVILYEWEDLIKDQDSDFDDVVMIVTFMGTQSGM